MKKLIVLILLNLIFWVCPLIAAIVLNNKSILEFWLVSLFATAWTSVILTD